MQDCGRVLFIHSVILSCYAGTQQQTPLAMARQFKHTDIAQMLAQVGAV